MGRLFFAWVLIVAAGAVESGAMAADRADFATYTLPNGLEVVVIPDHRAPVAVHMVWYRVGAVDEPWGKSGLAHVVEHLMFRGTETIPPGRFSQIVARNGGRDNAFTSDDYTGYYQMVAKDRLPVVMELEADRMVNLSLTEEVVAPELKVVIEERRSRVDNEPGALLSERMNAVQYLQHPYREPLIGWLHELEALTRDDVMAFYDRHYTPRNAILVVAGDVTGPQVRDLAEQYYGGIEGRALPDMPPMVEPPQLAPRRVTLSSPKVGQPLWRRSYLAPSAVTDGAPEAAALEVLAQYLGSGTLSRLYQDLVVDRRIAVSAGAFYSPVQRDKTTFGLYAVPAPGQSMETIEAAVEDVIAEIAAGAIDAADLDRGKTLLKADTVYARDSLMQMAVTYGRALSVGLSADFVRDWPDAIERVTAEDVAAAARDVLRPETSVTGVLLPQSPSGQPSAETAATDQTGENR